jgi:hypothetical protein
MRTFLTAVLLAALCGGAQANMLLKPTGGAAMPLRVKSLTARAEIDGQFAVTTLNYTFLNESADRLEADFIYSLPPGAVATYFAYWFGDEKVVARIVEKEQAAQIYQHITSRMRDPALIEMIGKNTFRARIFPVMPHADLRVEIVMAQALPSDSGDMVFTLPLQDSDDPITYERLDVRVTLPTEEWITEVSNNYGLERQEDTSTSFYTLTGKNFRPSKDLRVRLKRAPAPLQTSLYSARSGGQDGFFALALTPDQSLQQPRVRITGVSSYEPAPAKLPDVKAHHVVVLTGRYKGSGEAQVTLTGQLDGKSVSYTGTVTFAERAVANNLATKLWAAERMDDLDDAAANRERVMRMSHRFCLPSKYTSWLAIPTEELKRYKEEKLQAELDATASRLAELITAGQEHGAEGKRLSARLATICKELQREPKQELHNYLSSHLYDAAYTLARYTDEGKGKSTEARKLRARLERICRLTGVEPAQVIEEGRLWWARDEIENTRDQLYAEMCRDTPDMKRARRLEERFKLCTRLVHGEGFEGTTRLERIKVKAELERIERQLEEGGDSVNLSALQTRRTVLAQRAEELRVRMGDPLISVEAPADAWRVIALLPNGEIKKMEYNTGRRRWEARFDVPAYTPSGEYVITIIIVRKDGTRSLVKFTYHVDTTPPRGTAAAEVAGGMEPVLRLTVDASADTARVMAMLPWGARAELTPSSKAGRFFALVAIPEGQQAAEPIVTFVLTDKAHNRMSYTVDMRQAP